MNELLNILKDIRPDCDFENSDNFIKDGYLDSLDIMSLITTLEEKYCIEIGIELVEEENFKSLYSIAKIVKESGGNI